ncbi:argininosuccinate lyase [Micromonospora sp. NBS 11-29]|uniref:argininosuccinate lyase n=1 Tax=Micromonospora sp. NBS 11-29 TaxID=1960879 RepID=UPI000B77C395|nr:argininosuccinate lyase [Micromonospora sp. NBS 11-29]
MTGAGRLTSTVGPRTRRILYGDPGPAQIRAELGPISTVDLAHVVMLAEQDLLPGPVAARLLERIVRMRADGFADLCEVAAPRGLYLAYEQELVRQLGADVGGRLHTGRSRNDLKATTTALRLRSDVNALAAELLRLQAVLLNRARRHHDTVMPVYTHFQPAMPVTYAYHLVGTALAVGRDVLGLRQAVAGLDRCPLGAGAVAGTDLPIDPARTAALLGFAAGPVHATDAVASRDGVLRVLAAAATAAVTLSRLGTDMQLWSTQEFGFLTFPDRLVGGSSAMPQKRNAFLLEHVKAAAGPAIGAWTAAAATMKSTPFTNTIEVGTEAVGGAGETLRRVGDAARLTQALVSGARPVVERMRQRADEGFVTATSLANRLVRDGVPFRTAHDLVGAAVRTAMEAGGTTLPPVGDGDGGTARTPPPMADLIARTDRGGGPGAVGAAFDVALTDLADHAAWFRARHAAEQAADRELRDAVRHVVAGGASS